VFASAARYIDFKTGGKGSNQGNSITVSPGQTVDLGEIKVFPAESGD
jgi:hypothetical protein